MWLPRQVGGLHWRGKIGFYSVLRSLLGTPPTNTPPEVVCVVNISPCNRSHVGGVIGFGADSRSSRALDHIHFGNPAMRKEMQNRKLRLCMVVGGSPAEMACREVNVNVDAKVALARRRRRSFSRW